MFTRNQTYTALATLSLLIVGYFVYEQTLGQITDFEQLPAELASPLPDDVLQEEDPDAVRESDIAAIRGFGPDCEEVQAPMAIENLDRDLAEKFPGRGIGNYVYLQDYRRDEAADPEKDPDANKRLIIHPFSLVQIKPSPNGRPEEDEIITVRGDRAVITFEHPVVLTNLRNNPPRLGKIEGNVEIKTNNRTTDPVDDMVLFTPQLNYDKEKNLIWTDKQIRVVAQDRGTVDGQEMELELYPETKPGEPKRKEPAKRLRIFRDVRFDLLVSEDENFLGPAMSPEPKEVTAADEPPKLMPLTITSRGPFDYDIERMKATFTRSVRVLKRNPPKNAGELETIDQMESDQLDLQFRNKSEEEITQQNGATAAGSDVIGARAVKLQSVTATGKRVILMSVSEQLQATGNYLFYDADSRRAILKSEDELVAVHSNAIIHARSLVIEHGEQRSEIRNFIADGPSGWLEVLKEDDIAPPEERQAELKIRWEGRLLMEERTGEDSRLVTITKNVELEDKQGALKCDQLKVWLVPAPDAVGSRRKFDPVKLEATGNVSSHSAEISSVSESLSIDILKRKAPVVPPEQTPPLAAQPKPFPGERPPETAPAAQPISKSKDPEPKAAPAGEQPIAPAGAQESGRPTLDAVPRNESPPVEEERKQPMEVKATRVAVVVERIGNKTRPIRAWADGDVLVTQAPAKPEDDAVEVRGQTLHFERKPDGDFMKVEGSERRVATVKTDDAIIVGHNIINFDEVNNRVIVTGPGYIIRNSANNLMGDKLDKPGQFRIDWERRMDFDGKLATFEGGVKAQMAPTQAPGEIPKETKDEKIHCQNMDVTFDRRIVFKEQREKKNRKQGQTAAVESVDCDKDVVVYQSQRNNLDGSFRITTMEVAVMHYDSQFKSMTASGPGRIKILETNKPKEDEKGVVSPPKWPYQFTQIMFQGEMRGGQENKTAKFFENVHIIHTPVKETNETVDEDNLNPDGLVVRASDYAVMAVSAAADGSENRDFQAEGNVQVHAREFWGQCDRLSYDQQKDKLVFDSQQGRKSNFYRQLRIGEEPQRFYARSITFIRKENRISTDSSDGFNSLDIAPGKPLGR